MWALDAVSDSGPFFGMGREKQKYQESHTKVSQVFEVIQNLSALSERPVREDRTSNRFELKSLILAQIERWRHALHMQVGRQRGLRPGGEWRTGE